MPVSDDVQHVPAHALGFHPDGPGAEFGHALQVGELKSGEDLRRAPLALAPRGVPQPTGRLCPGPGGVGRDQKDGV